MKGDRSLVLIRADLWNTTQALPKAIEASNSLFEKISILEWVKHPEKIDNRAQTTPFSLFSYKGLISSNIITRALCVIRYLAWV